MGPYTYTVHSIKGDYAYLIRTDINSEELFMIALALLPEGTDIGVNILWENLEYSII